MLSLLSSLYPPFAKKETPIIVATIAFGKVSRIIIAGMQVPAILTFWLLSSDIEIVYFESALRNC